MRTQEKLTPPPAQQPDHQRALPAQASQATKWQRQKRFFGSFSNLSTLCAHLIASPAFCKEKGRVCQMSAERAGRQDQGSPGGVSIPSDLLIQVSRVSSATFRVTWEASVPAVSQGRTGWPGLDLRGSHCCNKLEELPAHCRACTSHRCPPGHSSIAILEVQGDGAGGVAAALPRHPVTLPSPPTAPAPPAHQASALKSSSV